MLFTVTFQTKDGLETITHEQTVPAPTADVAADIIVAGHGIGKVRVVGIHPAKTDDAMDYKGPARGQAKIAPEPVAAPWLAEDLAAALPAGPVTAQVSDDAVASVEVKRGPGRPRKVA